MGILNNSEVVDQTQAIERIPAKPGLIGALGLYRTDIVGTDSVSIDVRDNSMTVLEDHLRNVAQKNSNEDVPYDIHTFRTPHFPIEKTIGRDKLAGIRGFGREAEETVAAAVAEELQLQSERLDHHIEYMSALMTVRGSVATGNYGTYDMAQEFGVTRPSVTLTDAAGEVLAGLRDAQRQAKAGLKNGGRSNGFVLLASETFFEQLIATADLQRAYELSVAGTNPLMNQLGEVANGYSMFRFGNTDVILYDDTFQRPDGTSVDVLADGNAVLVPRANLGRILFGPECTLSGLSNGGARKFARVHRDPKDRYIEVSSETNALPIAEQFAATVELSFAA